MFVTWISFRGTFQSFWDFTEVSAQSRYKLRTDDLDNPTFEIRLLLVSWIYVIHAVVESVTFILIPKLLLRCGLLVWTWFRLILKKTGSLSGLQGWGRHFCRDSCRAEQPENLIWYKLSWKRRQLGGVCQALSRHSLHLAGAVRSVLVDYREGLAIRTAGYKLCSVEKMACSWCS